jgi:hypothetical protein
MGPQPPIKPRKQPVTPKAVLEYLGGKNPYAHTDDQVAEWLQKNPGWVGHQWKILQGLKRANDVLGKAGYYTRSRGSKTVLRNPNVANKDLWSWGTKPVGGAPMDMIDDPAALDKARTKPTKPAIPDRNTAAAPVDPISSLLQSIYGSVPGIDASGLSKLGLPKSALISAALANQGGKPMTPAQIDQLVSSITQGSTVKSMYERDRENTLKQNESNLSQIKDWYGQVTDAQGVATQRDAEFGKQALDANTATTQAIIGSLGGEANQGSYVVGAQGENTAGTLNALGQIQNQYNADIAPLLKLEGAGALAREQGAGAARLRDLSRSLMQQQSQASSDEAKLRFDVWQQNNQLANDRLTRLMQIKQYNQGLRQQDFNNQLGVVQAGISAQTAGAQLGASVANSAGDFVNAATRAAQADKPKSKWLPWGTAPKQRKEAAYGDIVNAVKGRNLSLQQAITVATQIMNSRGYGWSVKNPGVRATIYKALTDAGYDVPTS